MRRVKSATNMSAPRLIVPETAERRRRRNNRKFRLPGTPLQSIIFSARWVSLALLALMVYALAMVGMDEHFFLTTIPVEGAASILPAEVVEASGLAGIHVFAADPGKAASQITQLPAVVSASVSLGWPNEVSIHIQENTPLAVWQDGFSIYWVTEGGRLIPVRSAPPGMLVIESELPPVVSDDPDGEPRPSLEFVPEDLLHGALLLQELRPNIDKLYYRPSGGLSYQDGRGWRVYFGTGTDMEQKLVVYEQIVEQLTALGVVPTSISVSNQEKPYYSLR